MITLNGSKQEGRIQLYFNKKALKKIPQYFTMRVKIIEIKARAKKGRGKAQ